MLIKKIEFDFEIKHGKYHKYIFNRISRIVKNDFDNLLSKILKKFNHLDSSKDIVIDKIEINISDIYIQEIENLTNLIEKHLEIEFYYIFQNSNLVSEKRTFDAFLNEYSSSKLLPWWLNSEKKLTQFLKKENIIIHDNEKVLTLILEDFIFFEKIYNLLSKDDQLFFIKKILGDKYEDFQKIIALKKDIYYSFHKHYSTKNTNNYIVYSSVKDVVKYSKKRLFHQIMTDEFSSKNIGLDIILKEYDQFIKILNSHSKKFSRKSKKNIQKKSENIIEYEFNDSFSDFSYLKNYFSTINFNEKSLLLSSFSKEGLKKFNNQEFFLKKIFQDSELFIEFLESNRNINSIILLSKVSLTNEFKEEANFLLDEICESYRTIEENFLEFHNTLDFTNKSDEFIQVFVRYTYLNSLSKNPDFKLVENDFHYELFTHIAKSGDLNKKKIKSFLNNRNTLDPKFNDVLLSLSNTYKYSQIPQTTRTKIFFKDMYFHFLKSNQLTFWSDRSSISKNEIYNFIKLLVKNNDEKYLRSLFQEDLIISNQLINELIEDDLELFFDIIYILSGGFLDLKSDDYSLFLKDQKFNSIIIQKIFEKKLWNLKSLNYINKIIFNLLSELNYQKTAVFKNLTKINRVKKLKSIGIDDSIYINFNENLFSDKDIQNKEINLFITLAEHSIHECIIELSCFSHQINFYHSRKFKSVIDQIKNYFKGNKKELLHYLFFFNENKINQSFLFNLFSLDYIIEIFELKFTSKNIKDIFIKIVQISYQFPQTSIVKFLEFLTYLNQLKLISKNEIIDILSFNQDYNNNDFQVKLNFVFEKEKLLENNLQDNKIDTLLTNETHSMDDLIIELSFNQQINFQYSLKFKSLIKKIKDYFKQNKKEISLFLLFFNKNDINKSFLFNLFSLNNIIEIFESKFTTNLVKDVFIEIFETAYRFSKTDKSKLIELLIYLNQQKTISTDSIITLLSFNKEINSDIYLSKLKYTSNQYFGARDTSKILSDDVHIDPLKNLKIDGVDEIRIKEIEKVRITRDNIVKTKNKLSKSGILADSMLSEELNYKKFSSFDQYSNQIKLLERLIGKIDDIFTEHIDEDSENLKNQINDYKKSIEDDFIINNFNILTYYVEFGSFPYDSKTFNFKQLKVFFIKAFSQNIYLVKKHLFNWSKSALKLDRFFSIVYVNYEDHDLLNQQFENILRIIYPDLSIYLTLFMKAINVIGLLSDDSIYQLTDLNDNGFKNYDYDFKRVILKRILLSWPKYKFIVKDSSEFLIETFFSEMINLNKIFEYDQMVSNPRLLEINQSHKFYLKSLVQNLNNKIESKKNKSVKKTKIKDSIDELKDGIIIYNAGLLLFWPFLNTLFIKLNLLNLRKDNYKDEISKDKAIMATDYIVNGLDSKEKDFIFNKILCGIDLDREIDSSVELVDFELEICDSAIQALLSNWKKVKSPQTLRDWYLKREGRLIEKEDSFIIDIENKPPDIFLKSLSWGISMVNYSLMKKKLIVNWKY